VNLIAANPMGNTRRSSPWRLCGSTATGRTLGRLSKRCMLASPIRVEGEKRMRTMHRLRHAPALTEQSTRARRSQMQRFSVRCQLPDECRWLAEIISRETAGKRRGNDGLNGMAGEFVALNPALRERNRNLKGCGLTGLLFRVGIAPATLRSKNSRQSPRRGCAGASSEGGNVVFGKRGPAHFAGPRCGVFERG